MMTTIKINECALSLSFNTIDTPNFIHNVKCENKIDCKYDKIFECYCCNISNTKIYKIAKRYGRKIKTQTKYESFLAMYEPLEYSSYARTKNNKHSFVTALRNKIKIYGKIGLVEYLKTKNYVDKFHFDRIPSCIEETKRIMNDYENRWLATQLPFSEAPNFDYIRKHLENSEHPIEVQFDLENWVPALASLRQASDATTKVMTKIGELMTSVSELIGECVQPRTVQLVLFILNQVYLLKDNMNITKFISFLISIFLFLGKSYKEVIGQMQQFLIWCTKDNYSERINPDNYQAETEFDLISYVEPLVNNLSSLSSVISGGVVMIAAAVFGVDCSFPSLINKFTQMKRLGDGAASVQLWVKQLLDFIKEMFYKQVYGCTPAEKELMDYIPEFAKFQKDVFTLCSIPSDAFLKSKELCEVVKKMYVTSQKLSALLMENKNRTVSKEMSAAYAFVERKFYPIYETVKTSPLFLNVTRTRPRTLYMYGKPGVGKSNMINLMAVQVAKKLYPDRTFNGENAVMWSRRIENEFHDGYAHQPIVQFDDFLQTVDTKAKPNKEITEFIYMVNDAPYQLHMSDIREKKNVYFDSEHVWVSTNMKVPQAESIHDVGALRRRFDAAIEVRVKPEFGKQVTIKNESYYIVDDTKVNSPLDTRIYEIHPYNIHTGQANKTKEGTDLTLNYEQFLEWYIGFCEDQGQRQKDTRKIIYEQLNITVDESDRFDELFTEFPDLDDVLGYNSVEPDETAFELPSELPLAFDLQPSAEIITMFNSVELEEEVAYLDEEQEFPAYDPERKLTLIENVKEKFKQMCEAVPKLYTSAWKRIMTAFNVVREQSKKLNKYKIFGIVGLVATAIAYLFWPQTKCRVTPTVNDIFARICSGDCADCSYIRQVCGGAIKFRSMDLWKQEHAEWNLKAAEIMSRKDVRFRLVVKYWNDFLDDIQPDTQFSRYGRGIRARRYHARSRQDDIRAGSDHTFNESYGRDLDGVIRAETYGRETITSAVAQFDYITAGTEFNIGGNNSLSAATEQYFKIALKNQVTIRIGNATAKGLFVAGRNLVVNQHYKCFIENERGFYIVNPFTDIEFFVGMKECKFERVTRNGLEQDLMIINLPKCVPARPNILSKIISRGDLGCLEESPATLVSLSRLKGKEYFREQHLDTVFVCNVNSKNKVDGKIFEIRQGYGYDADTKGGDCGSMLFTHCVRAAGKLIGLHSAGNGKGQGYSEALVREDLERHIKNIEGVTIVAPELGFPYTELDKWNDLGDVIHHGDVEKPNHQVQETAVIPSPLQGILAMPTMAPAMLSTAEIDGRVVDPLKNGLRKVSGKQVRLNKQLLDLAVEDVKRTLKNTMTGKLHGVLTYEQAIEGVEGDDYIGGLKRNTSPGHDWLHKKKTMLKGKYEWLNVIDENGQATNEWNLEHPELKQAVIDRIEKAKQGERVRTLYAAKLKDERRVHEKVKLGKTRVFTGAPMDFTIAVRQYFCDFVAAVMACRGRNEMAVGIDPTTEWPDVVRWVTGLGENMIAGDFSNFDGSLSSEVLWAILQIMNDWYDDSDENKLVREVLYEDVVNAFVVCGGHVVQWTHAQPSGNPMTVIINSLFQLIMFRYVYLDLKCKEGLPLLCDFRRHVRMITYGDDGVLGVSERAIEWFNQKTITEAFMKVGLTYTDEQKGTAQYICRPLSEVSFLKRGFKRVDGIWTGPIDPTVIYEMCLWTRKGFPWATFEATLEFALREATLHGEQFYRRFAGELEVALRKCGRVLDIYTYPEMLAIMFPTYF